MVHSSAPLEDEISSASSEMVNEVGQKLKNHKCTLTFYYLSSSLTHSLLHKVLPRLLLNPADILN